MRQTTRTPLVVGHIPPRRITEGTISCRCGYRGKPLEVSRWIGLEPAGWLGLCPCGSSKTVHPRVDP